MILDAATEVFAEQGYEAGSIDAIGARMGISGPAIYRHFARKQDIVVELLVKAVDAALADVEIGSGERVAGSGLNAFVAKMVGRVAAEQDMLALLHAHMPDLDADNRNRIAEARDRLLERWSGETHRHRPELDPDACRMRVLACFATVGALCAVEASSETIERLLLALLSA